MPDLATSSHILLSDESISDVGELLEAGLYLQAYEAAKPHGKISSWRGHAALILGGRLISNLGSPRSAAMLHHRAYRLDRKNPAAAYFRAARIYGVNGGFRAWKFLNGLPDFCGASPGERADLLALRARVLAAFRDFQRAEPILEQALSLAPERAWLWCEKAEILRTSDDVEGALRSAEQALTLRPFYRPAVQLAAELLQALNRDADALKLLVAADDKLESGRITCQLASLQTELGDHEGALRSWLRVVDLHPMAERDFQSWLDANLADAYYRTGQFELAREHAGKADGLFYKDFSKRLAADPQCIRVILPVRFVAQNHLTCAPATMSALGGYWNVPIDHEELAAEICYEGTQDHIERHWAEEHGFVVREFRMTWDTACALIDRGVPFSLETVETTTAHLQGVIGYDRVRGTFLLREPSQRVCAEVAAESFLERYAPFGPRAMLMLPPQEARRLEGLDLPDTELYDAYYRLQRALEKHDRATAADEHDRLATEFPGHRLALRAKRRLAIYDANSTHELEAIGSLIDLFPKCGNFLWIKSLILGRLASGQEEHRGFLQDLATSSGAEPVFWRDWGRELGRDGRRIREAQRYLLLALRMQPYDADNLAELANSLWDERRFEAATEIYRFAAGLPGGGERFGRSYFLAARHVRKTEEALEFLRKRFRDSGKASVQPIRAYCFALSCLDRDSEGLELLHEALSLRPNDGELLLFAADEFARHGSREKAEKILAGARDLTSRTGWLRAAAGIAGYRCEHVSALGHWRKILEAEPLAMDAQRAVSRLIAETEGRAATLDFLSSQIGRFPHYAPLIELHIEWLRDEPPAKAEPLIRRALKINPDNAWTHRELAINLTSQRRFEEAIRTAREALQMEPLNSISHGILGHALRLAGYLDESAEVFRSALRLSVDYTWAIHELFAACKTFEKKGGAVEFVRQELIQQVIFGDGVSAFREEAFTVLNPETLLAVLREAHAARKDLWQTWVAVIEQLVDMKQLDEALEVASQAVKAFPLLPRCWYELATVRKARGEWDEEILAHTQALALSPGWSTPSRALAEVYDRRGDFARSREILEQAVAFSPLEAGNHGGLADVLWRLGEREAAVRRLQHAIRLSPDYQWAWNILSEWSVELGRENLGLELARELTVSRSGEPRSWLRLASSLDPKATKEKLAALDRAAAIDPANADIHDSRACTLAQAGRYDEAADACRPAICGANIPLSLQGRAAWIQAERGDLVTATEMMRKVVKQAPDYYWGWNMLTDWLTASGKFHSALEAAENMARLAPRASVPLGYIADIQLRQGNEREAWEAFREAYKLDPAYEYAGFQLFEGHVKAGSVQAAEETLKTLQLHHPGARTDAARVRLDCKCKRKKEALEGLRSLCFTPERTSFALHQAAAVVNEAGWMRKAERIYVKLLEDKSANPEIGSLWVEAFTTRAFWYPHWKLLSLDAASPVGLAARHAYLKAATTAKKKHLVRQLVKRDGAALRANPPCWGQVGYALTTLELYPRTVEWMQDWRVQPDVQPWMLFNLVIALRSSGDDAEARKVSQHALTLKGDHTTLLHHLFLAWDEALAGDLESAKARLAIIPSDDLPIYLKIVRALVVALRDVLGAEPNKREGQFATQKIILQQEAWRAQFNDVMLRRMGRKTVKAMAAACGKRRFRLGNALPLTTPIDSGGFRLVWVFLGIMLINLLRSCGAGN